MSAERERTFVADLYPSKKWKQKVRKMSDTQVLAIYLRAKKDAVKPIKDKPKEKPDVPF